MNSKTRGIVLHMVMAFVILILFLQLWLFTEALEAVHAPDGKTVLVASIVSGAGCLVVWKLIAFFLKAERDATGPRP